MSPVGNGRHELPDRRDSSDGPSARAFPSIGRRKTDHDPRTTITKKLLVVVVALVNAVYLVAEIFLRATDVCP
ncbi:hypothetical protein QIO91_gp3 [ssRNA phage Gerhypos.3_6]|uniref:Uncharacterized protein n=2 Tax=Leviviricetes TaxID=2842243 RepID=A0A8S5KZD5_9VIRU|nr:hypothetical protein QIO91_gp3 [ssRNA phage Gerhypos.3_6]QDH90284.1 MAG: hypothetical protein H1RhizoLitter3735_000003 [Leviviridae sp.]QDH90661.1 MAG: hypothetical protein H3Bulk41324_000003 [Leviviridae sp.]DAD50210.1 TPA_asm: hypothetical protein [ssRNA phage Gerhypos.3_6]